MASCSAPATAATPYFPPELIPEVARRLTSLQDFFALRASCRAYRAALPLTPSNLASQAPLLLLVPRLDQATALYHLPLRRLLRFRLPRARQDIGRNFVSLGCRVVIGDYLWDPSHRELCMVHLLTGEQTHLPSPVTVYLSFILSGDLLLNWDDRHNTIQSYRLGDADWSVASISEFYNLKSMVCVNGTIYVLGALFDDSLVYHLAVVELSDDRNSAELVFVGALHPQTLELPVYPELEPVWPGSHRGAPPAEPERRSHFLWLRDLAGKQLRLLRRRPRSRSASTAVWQGSGSAVPRRACGAGVRALAECRGELILIAKMEHNPRVYRVFKWKSGEDEWVRITSIGGCALFFESGFFQGCLGPDHPGIRKDCIYFNEQGLWSEYSSVDGSFRQSDAVYLEGKLQETFRAASSWGWVFPSMC